MDAQGKGQKRHLGADVPLSLTNNVLQWLGTSNVEYFLLNVTSSVCD